MNEAASNRKRHWSGGYLNLGDRPSYYWFDYYSITECIIRYSDHYQFDDRDQHFTDHPVYQISVGIHYVSNLVADHNDVSFRFEPIFHSFDLDPRKWRTRDRCLRQCRCRQQLHRGDHFVRNHHGGSASRR